MSLHDYIAPSLDEQPITVEHPLVQPEGIYFGLSEDVYHDALALSASGIKWLRVSSLDWWARSPLNPDREEEEDTEAKAIGKAYHKRIVEGRDAFDRVYAPMLDPAEYPTALHTVEKIKEALAAAGGPRHGLSGLRKNDLIDRLLEYAPDALIWERLVAEHNATHAGREQLPPRLLHKIEIAAAMIERHPDLSRAFSGGMPEVSIFWADPITGVPLKARLDYLKPRAIVDLKSFDHQGRPIDKAIARSVASYKYHIKCRHYLDAGHQARRLIREGKVFGEVERDYLDGLLAASEQTFMFVWQAKGVAPVARGKVLRPGSVLDIARMEVDQAKDLWARCWKTYGPDSPWLDASGVTTFDDLEFPAFLTE